MTVQELSVIGPFAKGEQPDPLDITFNDSAGDAINITGYTTGISFSSTDASAAGLGTGTTSIQDGPNGVARYVWATADFDVPGTFSLQFWIGSGTLKYASKVFKFTVEEATPEGTVA